MLTHHQRQQQQQQVTSANNSQQQMINKNKQLQQNLSQLQPNSRSSNSYYDQSPPSATTMQSNKQQEQLYHNQNRAGSRASANKSTSARSNQQLVDQHHLIERPVSVLSNSSSVATKRSTTLSKFLLGSTLGARSSQRKSSNHGSTTKEARIPLGPRQAAQQFVTNTKRRRRANELIFEALEARRRALSLGRADSLYGSASYLASAGLLPQQATSNSQQQASMMYHQGGDANIRLSLSPSPLGATSVAAGATGLDFGGARLRSPTPTGSKTSPRRSPLGLIRASTRRTALSDLGGTRSSPSSHQASIKLTSNNQREAATRRGRNEQKKLISTSASKLDQNSSDLCTSNSSSNDDSTSSQVSSSSDDESQFTQLVTSELIGQDCILLDEQEQARRLKHQKSKQQQQHRSQLATSSSKLQESAMALSKPNYKTSSASKQPKTTTTTRSTTPPTVAKRTSAPFASHRQSPDRKRLPAEHQKAESSLDSSTTTTTTTTEVDNKIAASGFGLRRGALNRDSIRRLRLSGRRQATDSQQADNANQAQAAAAPNHQDALATGTTTPTRHNQQPTYRRSLESASPQQQQQTTPSLNATATTTTQRRDNLSLQRRQQPERLSSRSRSFDETTFANRHISINTHSTTPSSQNNQNNNNNNYHIRSQPPKVTPPTNLVSNRNQAAVALTGAAPPPVTVPRPRTSRLISQSQVVNSKRAEDAAAEPTTKAKISTMTVASRTQPVQHQQQQQLVHQSMTDQREFSLRECEENIREMENMLAKFKAANENFKQEQQHKSRQKHEIFSNLLSNENITPDGRQHAQQFIKRETQSTTTTSTTRPTPMNRLHTQHTTILPSPLSTNNTNINDPRSTTDKLLPARTYFTTRPAVSTSNSGAGSGINTQHQAPAARNSLPNRLMTTTSLIDPPLGFEDAKSSSSSFSKMVLPPRPSQAPPPKPPIRAPINQDRSASSTQPKQSLIDRASTDFKLEKSGDDELRKRLEQHRNQSRSSLPNDLSHQSSLTYNQSDAGSTLSASKLIKPLSTNWQPPTSSSNDSSNNIESSNNIKSNLVQHSPLQPVQEMMHINNRQHQTTKQQQPPLVTSPKPGSAVNDSWRRQPDVFMSRHSVPLATTNLDSFVQQPTSTTGPASELPSSPMTKTTNLDTNQPQYPLRRSYSSLAGYPSSAEQQKSTTSKPSSNLGDEPKRESQLMKLVVREGNAPRLNYAFLEKQSVSMLPQQDAVKQDAVEPDSKNARSQQPVVVSPIRHTKTPSPDQSEPARQPIVSEEPTSRNQDSRSSPSISSPSYNQQVASRSNIQPGGPQGILRQRIQQHQQQQADSMLGLTSYDRNEPNITTTTSSQLTTNELSSNIGTNQTKRVHFNDRASVRSFESITSIESNSTAVPNEDQNQQQHSNMDSLSNRFLATSPDNSSVGSGRLSTESPDLRGSGSRPSEAAIYGIRGDPELEPSRPFSPDRPMPQPLMHQQASMMRAPPMPLVRPPIMGAPYLRMNAPPANALRNQAIVTGNSPLLVSNKPMINNNGYGIGSQQTVIHPMMPPPPPPPVIPTHNITRPSATIEDEDDFNYALRLRQAANQRAFNQYQYPQQPMSQHLLQQGQSTIRGSLNLATDDNLQTDV